MENGNFYMTEQRYTMHTTRIAVVADAAIVKGHFTAFGASLGRRLRWDIPQEAAFAMENVIIDQVVGPLLESATAVSIFSDPFHLLKGSHHFVRNRTVWTLTENMDALRHEREFWTMRTHDPRDRSSIAITCLPSESLISGIATSLFDPSVVMNLLSSYKSSEKTLLGLNRASELLTVFVSGAGLSEFDFFSPLEVSTQLVRIMCQNAKISIKCYAEPEPSG